MQSETAQLPSTQANADPVPAPRASFLGRLWPFALLLGILLLLWLFRSRIDFAPSVFVSQLRDVSPYPVLLALAAIYLGFILQATRWAVLLEPVTKTDTRTLVPSQFLGFTAVALFGRVADLARPVLVAKRLQTSIAVQLAVYSLERAFDLAAAAILFSVTLALAPRDMAHHAAFARAGLVSLGATLFLVIFAVSIRFAGDRLAAGAQSVLYPLSATLADKVRLRLLEFRAGFQTIRSMRQFLGTLAVSLLMWGLIAATYLESARAFRGSPVLGSMSFTGIMLLLATSLGASLLQLPVLGWFTQIAAIAAAYHGFYGVPLETASACGAVTLITTSLSIIPAGLIIAQRQGVKLRDASRA